MVSSKKLTSFWQEWNSPWNSFFLLIYLFGLSIIFAYLEIQIEGTSGWAENLPTWKKKVMGFNCTGYHLALWFTLFLLVHFPIFFVPWTLKIEFFILSFYFILLILEDSFWFLLNSSEFFDKKKQDPWRNPKVGGYIPFFYFICAGLALLFAILSKSLNWSIVVALSSLFVLVSYPFQVQQAAPAPCQA